MTSHPASATVLATVPISPTVPPPYMRLILFLARQWPRATKQFEFQTNYELAIRTEKRLPHFL